MQPHRKQSQSRKRKHDIEIRGFKCSFTARLDKVAGHTRQERSMYHYSSTIEHFEVSLDKKLTDRTCTHRLEPTNMSYVQTHTQIYIYIHTM